MKKNILFVLVLMSFCVLGIAGLQLHFSYTNYQAESKAFERNINEALEKSVETSFENHNDEVLIKFKKLLKDTSFVDISAKWNEANKMTTFTISQKTVSIGQNSISMSLDDFDQKLNAITPQAKEYFVNDISSQVDEQLKKGTVWFYTQQLGDSLTKYFYKTPLDLKNLSKNYAINLKEHDINVPFSFLKPDNVNDFQTKKVNISLRKPYKESWLRAYFSDPNLFLFQKLKWSIASSVILLFITFFCFWYTIRLLLSQEKLHLQKDSFISNMTHEINTPLSSILITAEALKDFDQDRNTQKEYLNIILHQTKKLAHLTDEILRNAKINQTKIVLNEVIDLKILLQEFNKNELNSEVLLEFLGSNLTIKGNKNHLTGAISNLVDNAIKYNSSQNPRVKIICSELKEFVKISVSDNGPGISDEFKDKIFEAFYRVPTGNVHNIKGYGLGLSYVHKVVSSHRGSISVADGILAGVTFTIKLPRHDF